MSPLPEFFLVKPVGRDFRINDRFNAPRNYSFAPNKNQLHEGLDLAAIDHQGNPVAVFAGQRGLVDRIAFTDKGYGNYVRIVHEWGEQTYVTWYGHLSAITVKEGQSVQAGQKIGIAGTTGFSTGIHLHLTLQYIGHGLSGYVVDDVVNPEPFFRFDDVPQFDEATFIADVTIPDGTVLKPGQPFVKTWRVRNTGTQTWDGRYRLAFAGNDPLGSVREINLPAEPVQPAQTVNLSVEMIAPMQPGRYRSLWQLRNPQDDFIPHDLFVDIEIKPPQAVDQAVFVADVTIPDGTVVSPGETFVKTWRMRNAGSTTWTPDYTLRHVADARMDGPGMIPLGRVVKPGETVELSVRLTAPDVQGRHRSTWMLHNGRGKPFDFDMYAEIQVPQKLTRPSARLSEMRWMADVTIPDETELRPGEMFVKTWRVRNSGETTWGPGYMLAFFGGDQMGAPDAIPLPHAEPGDTVELSVTLIAPTSPGLHRSTWKGRDPQGEFFEFDQFALIRVQDVAPPGEAFNEMSFVADVTVPDGTVMRPGEAFVKTWRVRNTGTAPWGTGYTFAFVGDHKMDGPDAIPLPPARPGAAIEVSVMLTAPQTMGLHKSTWQPRDARGRIFDFEMFALIDVFDPDQVYDMLDFMRGDGRSYDLAFEERGGVRQRVQTQVAGKRFYHVMPQSWEEWWADEHFVYHGADTSHPGDEVWIATENGQYGSAWVPRHMLKGVPFRRSPLMVCREKGTGRELPDRRETRVDWIVLEAVHPRLTLPGGIAVEDVAELAVYGDADGKPQMLPPIARYFYARHYGVVGFQGPRGRAALAETFAPGGPDLPREELPWLADLRA